MCKEGWMVKKRTGDEKGQTEHGNTTARPQSRYSTCLVLVSHPAPLFSRTSLFCMACIRSFFRPSFSPLTFIIIPTQCSHPFISLSFLISPLSHSPTTSLSSTLRTEERHSQSTWIPCQGHKHGRQDQPVEIFSMKAPSSSDVSRIPNSKQDSIAMTYALEVRQICSVS